MKIDIENKKKLLFFPKLQHRSHKKINNKETKVSEHKYELFFDGRHISCSVMAHKQFSSVFHINMYRVSFLQYTERDSYHSCCNLINICCFFTIQMHSFPQTLLVSTRQFPYSSILCSFFLLVCLFCMPTLIWTLNWVPILRWKLTMICKLSFLL